MLVTILSNCVSSGKPVFATAPATEYCTAPVAPVTPKLDSADMPKVSAPMVSW
ncbi:hypothetical protein [Leptothrix sp. BB-3]